LGLRLRTVPILVKRTSSVAFSKSIFYFFDNRTVALPYFNIVYKLIDQKVCFHILITFGIFRLPYTIRGIAILIYFAINIFISFFLVLILKYINAFPHEQEYIGNHAIDNTNFIIRCLVLAFFTTLLYCGLEITILTEVIKLNFS
jgi:hypothetical protein